MTTTRPGTSTNTSRRRAKRAQPNRRAERPPRELLDLVTSSLDDDQADDVVVVDLAGKTTIADFMVIASGRNPRHIGAMADHLKTRIKAAGRPSPPIEGEARGDWVLIDGGDVLIHLFRPEIRKLYNLEKMWGATWPEPDERRARGTTDPRRRERADA